MIKHIVCWKLDPALAGDARDRAITELKEKFGALAGAIPGLLRLEIGVDFSRSANSSDLVLYSEFESRAALDGYQAHPAHKAAGALVAAIQVERRMIDYEV